MSYTTRKQSQILDILGNVETLARMRPGKMPRMVTLQKQIYAKYTTPNQKKLGQYGKRK